ncbi:hypothetical protein [Maribacter hydrothermalis]|uniref:Zinc-ribbon 15 domain-containing protein n=1 Tax=Maribacter hydrothermalis TaxID=1836467 RepID=A0A1B7ZE23_9FLAO|nr:hypothetical protein [Maribacter hydrothermalis]APQ16551.1 hypothetical protein BTR34_04030 [Maribacter hydrothermalis]OBR41543.1 hypothetical protein A9200_13005 [Maribacter hydrothermalis]
MIFFGTGSANLGAVKTRNITCQHCNNQNTVFINIYRRHAHIFWIPVFPINKSGSSYCTHCKEVLSPKEMPEGLKMQYKNIKGNAKGPLWQFSGLAILACLIGFAIFSSGKDKENTQVYLSDPVVGDIYEYKADNGNYSTMKLKKVTEDSLYLSLNDFEISKKSRLYKIDKDENYPEITYGYSKTEMLQMQKQGVILDINRD